MVTKTKAKPKPATKKAPAKKPGAKKATKAAAKPAASSANLPEINSMVRFTGYRNEVSDDEIAFAENDVLYIVEIDDDETDGVLLSCIKAEDIAIYNEEGEDAVEGGQVAPSEIVALKGGALEKAREAFTPIVLLGRLAEMFQETDEAIDVAIELNQDIQQSYFWLGGALLRVLQEGKYLTENGGEYEGDEAFNDFCQTEFGFKASKGRNLARIYGTFSALPDFDPASLADIGWSIASKLEKYVTEDNVEEVLDVAREPEATQRTIDAMLKEKFVSADGTTASGKAATRGEKFVMKTMSFRFSEDSGESVEIAIAQCMKQHGYQSPELALEHIVVEWAQDHVETKKAKQTIAAKSRKAALARDRAAKAKEDAKPKPKEKAATDKAAATNKSNTAARKPRRK